MRGYNHVDHKAGSLVSIQRSLSYQSGVHTATSRGRGWKGVTLDLYPLIPQLESDIPAFDHHVLAYFLQGSARLEQLRAGRAHESVMRTGSVIVLPAGVPSAWRGAAAQSLRMRIPCDILNDAAAEIGCNPGRPAELLDMFHTRDILIGQLSAIFLSELERPSHPAQSLIVESTSCTLATHLLRQYDAFKRNETKLYGLGPHTLAMVLSYIEDHVDTPVTLTTLAGIANASRFHFARMFKMSTGLTPMAYLEQCRIRRAQSLIKERDLSLAEVAYAVGFADQSHFSRRFRIHTDCTPSHYARTYADKGQQLEPSLQILPRRSFSIATGG